MTISPILQTRSITKSYGGLLVTDGVSLDIRPGELHAIIGPNGAGKTTLINQLSGEAFPNSGSIFFCGENVTALPIYQRSTLGLVRSYQISSIYEELSVLENACLAVLGASGRRLALFSPLLADAGIVSKAADALKSAGLAGKHDVVAGDLAYGERRQLELGMAVATEPKCLLLDEPMAGMSIQESAKVVDLLIELKARFPILLIEHDMHAVFKLADRVSVLVYGKVIATGTPDEIRSNQEVRAVFWAMTIERRMPSMKLLRMNGVHAAYGHAQVLFGLSLALVMARSSLCWAAMEWGARPPSSAFSACCHSSRERSSCRAAP